MSADLDMFASADLAASDPLEYYKTVEAMCRLTCVDQSSGAVSAVGFSAQYLTIENLLVDLGNHQLLPSQEHYRAYLSAFASLVKAWSKLLGEEVARWEAAQETGGEGGDVEGISQLMLTISAVGQHWLGTEVLHCCERRFLESSDQIVTVELVLVLGLARALTIAGKLLLGLQESGLGNSKGMAGSSSGSLSTCKMLLARACLALPFCLTQWDATTGGGAQMFRLEALETIMEVLGFDVPPAAAAAADADAAPSPSASSGAPSSPFTSSSASNSSSSSSCSFCPTAAAAASLARTSGTSSSSRASSSAAPAGSSCAIPPTLPHRLSKLPDQGLPEAVVHELTEFWNKWTEKQFKHEAVVPAEERQVRLIADILQLCQVLLREVQTPLGCSNLGCTNMEGLSEAALARHKCKRCSLVYYCSRECQAAHWPDHKGLCNRSRKEPKQGQ